MFIDLGLIRDVTEKNEENSETVDCYSAGDRRFMEWGQRIRQNILARLLVALTRLGVTADHLTVIALVFGCLAASLLFYAPAVALCALFLHVLFDGLDGPLARHQNRDSKRGSFTDTASDQLVVLITTLSFMLLGILSNAAGLFYVFSYTIVVGFSMVRNALNIPYSWLVRPRFVVYFWAMIELYWLPGTLEYVVWFFNALLVWKTWTGFVRIRRRL